MKKYAAIVVAIMIAAVVHAGPSTVITNYYPSYISVGADGTFPDTGSSGLTSGKVYACFCLDDFSTIATNEVSGTNATSDIRQILYGLDDVFYTAVQELTSTNRPAQYTVKKSAATTGTTNIIVKIQYTKVTNIGLSDNDIEDE